MTSVSALTIQNSNLLRIRKDSWGYMLIVGNQYLFFDTAYLHYWLSVTIHFNQYNLCFYKYTEFSDKCKLLYFTVLHIRVVPLSFSRFVECPLSDTIYWMIGHFSMDVTERLMNTKVVFLLELHYFRAQNLLILYPIWYNSI